MNEGVYAFFILFGLHLVTLAVFWRTKCQKERLRLELRRARRQLNEVAELLASAREALATDVLITGSLPAPEGERIESQWERKQRLQEEQKREI